LENLANDAVSWFIAAAADAIGMRGRFVAAFSGGATAEKFFTALANERNAGRVDWAKTFVFFADERDVAPSDELSNYNLARRILLSRVPIKESNVHQIVKRSGNPARTASSYSETLRNFFGSGIPTFDLVILGMGEDGHIASLFPKMPALNAKDEWVLSSPPGALPPAVNRITLTLPAINTARRVMFTISGQNKAQAVYDALEGGASAENCPAAGVEPTSGDVIWLLDHAAASLLRKK
jgi:6-phosphogluconolactonase